MRELAAAALLLLALVLAALMPNWPDATGGGTLAATPALSPTTQTPPSWRGRDGRAGFVVCGSSDTWRRPSVAEENAHLAADPRYRDLRVDDASPAASTFAASAVLYDGAGNSSRAGLATLSGLWTDPKIGGVGCVSAEPQIWLFGYEPARYMSDDTALAELYVVPTRGYRMVVLTGTIRRQLVVVGDSKLGVFSMPTEAVTTFPPITSTPRYAPPASYAPAYTAAPTMPPDLRPIEFDVPAACQLSAPVRSATGSRVGWTLRCPGMPASRIPGTIVSALFAQGWLEGSPLTGEVHVFFRDDLRIDMKWLDGAGFPSDAIGFDEYYFCCAVPASPTALPPVALVVPRGCSLSSGMRTGEHGETIHWTAVCPPMRAEDLAIAVGARIAEQGWTRIAGTTTAATYSHGDPDLLLTLSFDAGPIWLAETQMKTRP